MESVLEGEGECVSVTLIFCVHVTERDATKSVTQRRHGKLRPGSGVEGRVRVTLHGYMETHPVLEEGDYPQRTKLP